ncbi:MAG: class I SAM-dependent methyltransferase [Tepidisphaeraceae bacterium]
MKSSVDEIRARFDADVERFSDLNVAQAAAIDSALCLQLIADGAAGVTPDATDLLDVGCGAGNWTLTLLQRLPKLNCTLLDLSQPMLDRAKERVTAAGGAVKSVIQNDVRGCDFADGSFDLITAGAVLHHLREENEWAETFAKFHRWLRPGGSVWIYDMVYHEVPALHAVQWQRYGDYLRSLGGPAMADKVFAYIDAEDTPRPLAWQLERLRATGFTAVDVLHKNGPFAAFMAAK